MQHFPKLLSSQIAFDIARVLIDGFDKHYRLFRQSSQAARRHFEDMTWKQAQAEARERIAFYDRRVQECIQALEDEYDEAELTDAVWREVKLHYIGMLTEHSQPELAETFFNSVCCNILHRTYFNNDFIFVWPTISTEYIEPREGVPAYRVYYPGRDGLRSSLRRVITNFQFGGEFADLERDVALVEARLHLLLGGHAPEANHQIQVLSSPFMRNKGAYIIGRLINGNQLHGFVIPVLHNRSGEMYLDTVLTDTSQLTLLFSFTRAYFMVDMEVPSAYVKFLRTILPNKPRSEIYTVLGLHKQGKAAFYRDFLHHLANSSDNFAIAPGIRGLVMVVFALPSFPYVFKVIKDQFPAPKETTRELVKEKYLLVKYHDRVGRMADTLEYSNVAFPRSRFSDELLAELKEVAPSLIEEDRDQVIVKHLYIERRMTPLNIWLTDAEKAGDEQKLEHGVREYGNAIKDLVAANIFPGDMLYKNFGVTRQGRVVFYDYDEIEYITDCNFRDIPAPRHEEDEMASEPWYHVAKNDVFPEQFGVFLLGNPKVRQCFMKHHAELLTADYWRERKQRIVEGDVPDTFPYPQEIRFIHQNGTAPATPSLPSVPAEPGAPTAPEAKAA